MNPFAARLDMNVFQVLLYKRQVAMDSGIDQHGGFNIRKDESGRYTVGHVKLPAVEVDLGVSKKIAHQVEIDIEKDVFKAQMANLYRDSLVAALSTTGTIDFDKIDECVKGIVALGVSLDSINWEMAPVVTSGMAIYMLNYRKHVRIEVAKLAKHNLELLLPNAEARPAAEHRILVNLLIGLSRAVAEDVRIQAMIADANVSKGHEEGTPLTRLSAPTRGRAMGNSFSRVSGQPQPQQLPQPGATWASPVLPTTTMLPTTTTTTTAGATTTTTTSTTAPNALTTTTSSATPLTRQ
ncbi:MAG: hypothetical protein Q7T87_22130 [Polaromonas sp.]|nr:hypothetical protein [Polaromonas sp.]